VTEDFRGDILGFLGSTPNYQELYKKALLDRDYHRTAAELAQMLRTAAAASQALQSLAQDLTAFNLEHYRELQGELTFEDLKTFVEAGILRLGGTFIPDGEFCRIEAPRVLLSDRNVAARYETACFRRDIAMRRKNADLMGIGHPLVDALIAHFKRSSWSGDVSILVNGEAATVSARYVLEAECEDGERRREYESVRVGRDGSWLTCSVRQDIDALSQLRSLSMTQPSSFDLAGIRKRVENAIADAEAEIRTAFGHVQSARGRLVGVALFAS
jgi:hypothetical protein